MPFGYVTVASTLVQGYMAGEAQDDANALGAEAQRIGAAGDKAVLDFEKEKYQDWKDIYGDLEQNVADFYNNLTPDFLIGAGLEAEAKEFNTAKNNINATIAQRGLGGSGLETDVIAGAEVRSAENRAEIRREAPFKVAEAKQGFLSSNLAAKSAAERNISSAMVRSGDRQERYAQDNYNRAQDSASSLYESAGEILGAGLSYMGKQSAPKVKTVNTGPGK